MAETKEQPYLLESYWKSLEKIDSQYQELENSRRDFLWYEDKQREANVLKDSQPFSSILSIQLNDGNLPQNHSRKLMEDSVNLLKNQLDEYVNTKKDEQKTILTLEQKFDKKLNEIREEIKKIKNESIQISSRISYLKDRIDNLKTARMGHIIFFVCIGILSAFMTGNFIATLVITGVVFVAMSFISSHDD